MFLGYLGFVSFIATQGVRRLRIDTEVTLAREIHEALAKPVAWQEAGFQVLGASFPAYEVGGDLIDAVKTDQGLTCLVADVSGHGVPAGTLMAALKSAARMRLLGAASIAELLTDVNRVLFAIKQSNMLFATAACLQIGDSCIEYGLAGHLPILHWSRVTRQVLRLSEGQIALGILESARYEQQPIKVGSGDLLVVVTDGLTEVTDRHDRGIGIEGIESMLAACAEEPLDCLFNKILGLVRSHGLQQDDQTLLLLRILGKEAERPIVPTATAVVSMSPPMTH